MARQALFILNGPNLNLLGTREPEIYGHTTLADIEHSCRHKAGQYDYGIDFRQSNYEGELVDWIQQAEGKMAGIIINAGAYTHTSVALHDALKSCDLPKIEVHLSNIFTREPFRHHSYLSPVVAGVICGFGAASYTLAIEAMHTILSTQA